MKKNKLLLLPLFLLPLVSGCDNSLRNETKTDIISSLLNHVNIDARLDVAFNFLNYEHYNFDLSMSINRDYGFINEDTPAIRENGNYTSITYYEGENGEAAFDVLDNNNEVVTKAQYINAMIVTYADRYTNPFSYIDEKDIDSSYNLKTNKASKILDTVFGVSLNVESAKMIVNDNLCSSIEFDIKDEQHHYVIGFDQYAVTNVVNKVKFNLNYDTPKLEKVMPKTNDDEVIKTALNNIGDNYTLTLTSPNLNDDIIVYNTGDTIYFHHGINSVGMANGDILYKKNGNNYDKFIYRYESAKFIKQLSNVKLENILPSFNNISYNLFDKQSEGIYYLDSTSATLNAELLILNEYNLFPGEGVSATVEVKDNHVTNITTIFGMSQRYIVNETLSNYGTTTLPSWLLID